MGTYPNEISIENGIFTYRNSEIQIPNNVSEHYEYAMNVTRQPTKMCDPIVSTEDIKKPT